MAIEDDDSVNLFNSDEEEDREENEKEVDKLYESRPKADAWQELSWDLDAIHRSDKAIITNINVLGSDDHTCESCDKINKGLSEDDKICL